MLVKRFNFARSLRSLNSSAFVCSHFSNLTRVRFSPFCSVTSGDQNDDHVTTSTFSDLNISANRIEYLKNNGIENMFPVQQATYKDIFNGKDVIARAKTGTGKTLAFVLPLIERLKDIRPSRNCPAIVILAPTRELALQVNQEITKLDPRLNSVTVYGGASMGNQARLLSSPVDIVVGTPGRVIHFIEEGTLDLSLVNAFVLDEADQMLDIGFKADIELIMSKMPSEIQTLLFSATIPPWIKQIAASYMKNPKMIDLIGNRKTPEKVTHYKLSISNENQREIALGLLLNNNPGKTLIFVDTKLECSKIVTNPMLTKGGGIRALHGDINQNLRAHTLKEFKSGSVQTLVATDVAARGLDIPGVDLVVNLRPPRTTESYIHRSGRGGRAGRMGESVTLCCGSEDDHALNTIKRRAGTPFANKVVKFASSNNTKETIEKDLNALNKKSIECNKEWASSISEKMGSENALAAVLTLLQNNNSSENFSMLTGAPKVLTVRAVSSSGSAVTKSQLLDMFKQNNIVTEIEETEDSEFVFDVSLSNFDKLQSTDSDISFLEVNFLPILKSTFPTRNRDRNYGGGRERSYGGGNERRFGGSRDRNYGGDRERKYGGGRERSYGGDRERKYGGGGGRDRNYGGDRERKYGGDRERNSGGRDRNYGTDRNSNASKNSDFDFLFD